MIAFSGSSDPCVPYPDALKYYNRVCEKMGGYETVKKFFKFYVMPGKDHGFNGRGVNDSRALSYSHKVYSLVDSKIVVEGNDDTAACENRDIRNRPVGMSVTDNRNVFAVEAILKETCCKSVESVAELIISHLYKLA